jgi:peptidoglycan/xylan/chitin deacetylase (PgdA/CDA1 family)
MKKFNVKYFMRTAAAWLYYGSGLFALHLWWRRRVGRSVLVLMFHRVLPADSPVLQNHLSLRSIIITAENFARLLNFLQKLFRFAAMPEVMQSGRQARENYCVVTFDDGYHDFLKYAWPILQQNNLPVTMFLPTALIGTSHRFWWDQLYHACMKMEHAVTTAGFGAPAQLAQELAAEMLGEIASILQRIAETPAAGRPPLIYRLVAFIQDWPETRIGALLQNLGVAVENERQHEKENALMSWEEIRSLRQAGVDFGSHTRHHYNLAAIATTKMREEVTVSRRELEAKLQEEVDSISFPGGHHSEEVLAAVAAAGYSHAYSTRGGLNRPGEETYRLRRVNIWDGMLQDFRGRFSPAVFALNLMRSRE